MDGTIESRDKEEGFEKFTAKQVEKQYLSIEDRRSEISIEQGHLLISIII